MSKVTFTQSISIDGYSAGPDPSLEEPLGKGGEELHTWVVELEAWRRAHGMEGGAVNVSTEVFADAFADIGAHIMGRNMFGGGPGPWGDDTWQGWWGDDPPFHAPVFVLTHYPRPPLEKEGGTTFHFVTEGFDRAFELAQAASSGAGIAIAGGASTVQQALRAGVVDEFWVHVVPVVLGGGTRFFAELGDLKVEQVQAVAGENVAHLKYRVLKSFSSLGQRA